MRKELLLFSLSLTIKVSFCSVGDDSPYFRQCVHNCMTENCTNDGLQYKKKNLQNLIYTITYWSCDRECEYQCMWKTVDLYQQRQYNIPQFYGKWPFIKILAMQEPASTAFSLLNLYAHLKMVKNLKREVRPGSPYLWMWYVHAVVESEWNINLPSTATINRLITLAIMYDRPTIIQTRDGSHTVELGYSKPEGTAKTRSLYH